MPDIKYSCILREGIPEEEIIRYAKEIHPRMIIMGTRLPEDAWKRYDDRWGAYYHESKAMYITYTSFSRGTYGNGDRTFSNKTGGFRFNAEDGSIGATESGHGGYVRGVKDEQY